MSSTVSTTDTAAPGTFVIVEWSTTSTFRTTVSRDEWNAMSEDEKYEFLDDLEDPATTNTTFYGLNRSWTDPS